MQKSADSAKKSSPAKVQSEARHQPTQHETQNALQGIQSEPNSQQGTTSPIQVTASNILYLQRTIGNAAVQRLLAENRAAAKPAPAPAEVVQRARTKIAPRTPRQPIKRIRNRKFELGNIKSRRDFYLSNQKKQMALGMKSRRGMGSGDKGTSSREFTVGVPNFSTSQNNFPHQLAQQGNTGGFPQSTVETPFSFPQSAPQIQGFPPQQSSMGGFPQSTGETAFPFPQSIPQTQGFPSQQGSMEGFEEQEEMVDEKSQAMEETPSNFFSFSSPTPGLEPQQSTESPFNQFSLGGGFGQQQNNFSLNPGNQTSFSMAQPTEEFIEESQTEVSELPRLDNQPLSDFPTYKFTVEPDDDITSESMPEQPSFGMSSGFGFHSGNDIGENSSEEEAKDHPFWEGFPMKEEMEDEQNLASDFGKPSETNEGDDLEDEDIEEQGFPGIDQEWTQAETHTLYATLYRDDSNEIVPTMIIQSLPLPVGTFLTEMDGRYKNLKAKADNPPPKVTAPPLASAKSKQLFDKAKKAADTEITSANKTFANKKSKFNDKYNAEEKVAKSLDPVIKKVMNLAKAMSEHLAVNTNRPIKPKTKPQQRRYTKVKVTGTGRSKQFHYVKKLSVMAERYRIEGLVATYGKQPDYLKSGLERDHQPHNGLLEQVSKEPEFAKRTIQAVTANHSIGAPTIMLHGSRHKAGRTFGGKAKPIMNKYTQDIKAERIKLAKALQLDISAAYKTIKVLKTPNAAGQNLVQALKDAEIEAKKAVKSGASKDIYAAIDQLEEAKKQAKTATFSKQKLNDTDFNNALLKATAYPDAIRTFCVDYLIASMKLDAQAIYTVIGKTTSFNDITNMPDPAGMTKAAAKKYKDNLVTKVKDQIDEGEKRILGTEDKIRNYSK